MGRKQAAGLYHRGGIWHVRFTAPDGRRVRRSAGTTDKQRAQEYLDRLRVEMWRVHRLGEKPRRTWQEATVWWLREKEHKATIAGDRSKLRWLHPYLGPLYLDEIGRELLSELAGIKKAATSAANANRYLALVRSILRMARDEWEWVEWIPRVRLYPEARKRVRWLRRDEAERLIAELPPHLADLAVLTLATGLRQRNASYLSWEQIDLERHMAWIYADQAKAAHQAFPVPLNEDAMAVLTRRWGEHPVYVVTYQGAPVDRTTTKAWYAALERAGIENFRWHDLRHTWASWHVQNGTSLAELQELGNWSCHEMVLRYAHLGGEHLKRAAERLNGTKLAQTARRERLRLVVSC